MRHAHVSNAPFVLAFALVRHHVRAANRQRHLAELHPFHVSRSEPLALVVHLNRRSRRHESVFLLKLYEMLGVISRARRAHVVVKHAFDEEKSILRRRMPLARGLDVSEAVYHILERRQRRGPAHDDVHQQVSLFDRVIQFDPNHRLLPRRRRRGVVALTANLAIKQLARLPHHLRHVHFFSQQRPFVISRLQLLMFQLDLPHRRQRRHRRLLAQMLRHQPRFLRLLRLLLKRQLMILRPRPSMIPRAPLVLLHRRHARHQRFDRPLQRHRAMRFHVDVILLDRRAALPSLARPPRASARVSRRARRLRRVPQPSRRPPRLLAERARVLRVVRDRSRASVIARLSRLSRRARVARARSRRFVVAPRSPRPVARAAPPAGSAARGARATPRGA